MRSRPFLKATLYISSSHLTLLGMLGSDNGTVGQLWTPSSWPFAKYPPCALQWGTDLILSWFFSLFPFWCNDWSNGKTMMSLDFYILVNLAHVKTAVSWMFGGEYFEPTQHHNLATQSTAEYWLLALGKNGPLGAAAGCHCQSTQRRTDYHIGDSRKKKSKFTACFSLDCLLLWKYCNTEKV